jgi:hypothetical protein
MFVDLVKSSYGSSEAVTEFYTSRNGYAYNTHQNPGKPLRLKTIQCGG